VREKLALFRWQYLPRLHELPNQLRSGSAVTDIGEALRICKKAHLVGLPSAEFSDLNRVFFFRVDNQKRDCLLQPSCNYETGDILGACNINR